MMRHVRNGQGAQAGNPAMPGKAVKKEGLRDQGGMDAWNPAPGQVWLREAGISRGYPCAAEEITQRSNKR